MTEWILVASRAEAKIFERTSGRGELKWIKTFENKKGRNREGNFPGSRPGVSYGKFSGNVSPFALPGKVSHLETVALRFSKRIARYLKFRFEAHGFSKLCICAEPKLMGLIKKSLRNKVSDESIRYLSLDIEKASTDRIQKLVDG